MIDQKVTDLLNVTSNLIDRNLILGEILSELYDILDVFSCRGFSSFKKEWISYHSYEGCEVDLIFPNGQVMTGIVDGITDDGAICLLKIKKKKSFHVGSISIRSRTC